MLQRRPPLAETRLQSQSVPSAAHRESKGPARRSRGTEGPVGSRSVTRDRSEVVDSGLRAVQHAESHPRCRYRQKWIGGTIDDGVSEKYSGTQEGTGGGMEALPVGGAGETRGNRSHRPAGMVSLASAVASYTCGYQSEPVRAERLVLNHQRNAKAGQQLAAMRAVSILSVIT